MEEDTGEELIIAIAGFSVFISAVLAFAGNTFDAGVESVVGFAGAPPAGAAAVIGAESEEETRSLTRIIWGSFAFEDIPVEGNAEAGFGEEGVDGAAAATAGFAGWAPSTFFKVSSTSVAIHPAPTKDALIESRVTPSFICEEI